ncbi:LysM peptidoglycan-binding domain-containing protein [Ornithinibacillus sp. L9]|uniref:LysM peptidoglycan-binding domain-containing protein n=1 Tax=Ornithinibacillus caprae TaxID=2678566 RepID=A0A6N8FFM8_9BACI|nr:cell wall hydrolase [Ornithinibacillus caprae]MUK88011.1 LysM peptidoglycan-binding domain-containing protein [Ornithinibacillus caprae]
MNKLKKLLLTITLTISVITLPVAAGAAPYTVQKGDSFWSIANENGVSVLNLLNTNNRTGSLLYAGETINIPDASVSQEDKELMAKLIHAEAKGEPYAGKVAVGTVILNRVDHEDFPNTIKSVIYERSNGYYAFSPVQDGAINGGYTDGDMKAVNEAIAFRGQGNGSLFFYNPKTAQSNWIESRDHTITIGNHVFAK